MLLTASGLGTIDSRHPGEEFRARTTGRVLRARVDLPRPRHRDRAGALRRAVAGGPGRTSGRGRCVLSRPPTDRGPTRPGAPGPTQSDCAGPGPRHRPLAPAQWPSRRRLGAQGLDPGSLHALGAGGPPLRRGRERHARGRGVDDRHGRGRRRVGPTAGRSRAACQHAPRQQRSRDQVRACARRRLAPVRDQRGAYVAHADDGPRRVHEVRGGVHREAGACLPEGARRGCPGGGCRHARGPARSAFHAHAASRAARPSEVSRGRAPGGRRPGEHGRGGGASGRSQDGARDDVGQREDGSGGRPAPRLPAGGDRPDPAVSSGSSRSSALPRARWSTRSTRPTGSSGRGSSGRTWIRAARPL